jgi:ribosomal protein S18 acetylase RimI-like enzyme
VISETVIRPALVSDEDAVTRLIYLSMGIEADWLFEGMNGKNTLGVLGDLFQRIGNRVSYPLSHVAEQDDQVVGLLLAYPGARLSRYNWTTGLHLLQKFGLAATLRLARKQSLYGDLKETEPDEFYISNLGVFPEYQGRGLGSKLMAFAEQLALKAGLKKCSLIVTFGHENARRLYERLGYQLVRSFNNNHAMIAEGSGGYHRMVKTLTQSPEIV